MPPLHRYLGNPVLSFVGRLFFTQPIGDFHCGLRGFRRDAIMRLGLQTTGMEFASEMVVKSTLEKPRHARGAHHTVARRPHPPPAPAHLAGRLATPALPLLYSPRWLFFIPGLILMTIGLVAGIALSLGPVHFGDVVFDVDTLVGASAVVVIGFQAVLFALFTKVYAMEEGFLPHDRRVQRIIDSWSLERGLVVGGLLAIAGIVGIVMSVMHWQGQAFGQLDPRHALRLVVPSATALMMSFQMILASLFVSILGIRRRSHPPYTDAAEEAADVVDAAAHQVATENAAKAEETAEI